MSVAVLEIDCSHQKTNEFKLDADRAREWTYANHWYNTVKIVLSDQALVLYAFAVVSLTFMLAAQIIFDCILSHERRLEIWRYFLALQAATGELRISELEKEHLGDLVDTFNATEDKLAKLRKRISKFREVE